MPVYHYILVMLLGASLGSFINAFAYRWPIGESLWHPRSHCPSCKTFLNKGDLIPVLSFSLLGGRCRSCKTRIPASYVIIEMLMAVSFGLLFYFYGVSYAFIQAASLVTMLITCAEVDRRTGLIPNIVLVVGAVAALGIYVFSNQLELIVPHLVAAVGSAALLYVISQVWYWIQGRPGFGMGDVKLIAVVCLFIGWNGLWAFYLATICGALIGIAGIALGRWERTSRVPFGPSLALGGSLAATVLPFSTVAPLLWL